MCVFLGSRWLIAPRNHMGIQPFLITDLVLSLQPVPSCGGGQLRHLVPLQLPHLPHHAGGQLVLDALAVPWLQVSPRALPARPRGSAIHPQSWQEPWGAAPKGELPSDDRGCVRRRRQTRCWGICQRHPLLDTLNVHGLGTSL